MCTVMMASHICLLLGFSQVYLHFPSPSLLSSIWICEFVPDDSGLDILWFWHPSAAMLCRIENSLTVLFVGIQVLITSYWLAIWRCYPLSWFKCFLGPSWTYIPLCYLHLVARGFMGWKCMKLWFDLVPGEFLGVEVVRWDYCLFFSDSNISQAITLLCLTFSSFSAWHLVA